MLTPSRSMFREALRQSTRRGQQIARGMSMPAPIEGWDASSPIAEMSKKRALLLDNWFPTPADVRVRRGNIVHASEVGTGRVDSIMPYHGVTPAASKLFAAGGTAIYDCTSEGVAVAVVTGLAGIQFEYVNFTTSGGKFLWVCNGVDGARHFNGTSWATPTLNITTFAASDIIHVNAHKGRLWVVFKNSTVAGYLATGSIAGDVTNFDFGGLFTKGGFLVATATWTRDGGDGEDDLFVAISSQGQVVVYAGTDPASANTWALIGVYDIAPPIGRRCLTKVGGDLAIVTIDGIVPISGALQGRDRDGLADVALTERIRNAINVAAQSYKANFGWQFMPYPKGGYALLNVPIQAGTLQHQYVMNTETGAWCRYIGQNANCWGVFLDDLYFGANNGTVRKADVGSFDVAQPILATGQGAYSYYKSPGLQKDFKLLQALLSTDSDLRPALGVSTDFRDNANLGTPTAAIEDVAQFDEAIFDAAMFPVEDRTVADWASISGVGYSASIHFEAQTGSTGGQGGATWGEAVWGEDVWAQGGVADIDLRLNGFTIVYEQGLVL